MRANPAATAEARAWFLRARTDIRAAEVDLQADPPLEADALFHCQQACEKAMKALLIYHQRPYRNTHSLEEAGEAVLRIDRSLKFFVDNAVPLTEWAIAGRYPGHHAEPDYEEAQEGLKVARQLVDAIKKRLPKEAVR